MDVYDHFYAIWLRGLKQSEPKDSSTGLLKELDSHEDAELPLGGAFSAIFEGR